MACEATAQKSKAEILKPLMSASELKLFEGLPGWRLNQRCNKAADETKQRRCPASGTSGGVVSPVQIRMQTLTVQLDEACLTSVHTRHAAVVK